MKIWILKLKIQSKNYENIKNELTNAKEQLEIAEKRNTERIECELNLNAYTEKCNQTDEKIEEITAKITMI